MKKKILILSPDFPYPANHGGRFDILNKIICLNSLGYEVDLVVTVNNDPKNNELEYLKKYCNKIIILKRKRNILSLLSFDPFQVCSRTFKYENLKEIFNNNFYFSVFIEGQFMLKIFEYLSKKIKFEKIFLRIHNDEVKYFQELYNSEVKILKKIFYFLETQKIKLFQEKNFPKLKFTNLSHVSKYECDIFSEKYPYLTNIFLPVGVDINNIVNYKLKQDKTILFIGSFFMPNNVQAISWYLENIHEKILKNFPNYKLIIAGNTKDVNLNSFYNFLKKFKNIDFIKNPDENTLSQFYSKSKIFINPMQYGAGVKLKTINAILNGLPVVSTLTGNEGTGLKHGEHLLVANNIKEFIYFINLLFNNELISKNILNNAQNFIKNNYNYIQNISKLIAN